MQPNLSTKQFKRNIVQNLFPATCVCAQAIYTANQTWFAGTFPVEFEGFFLPWHHGSFNGKPTIFPFIGESEDIPLKPTFPKKHSKTIQKYLKMKDHIPIINRSPYFQSIKIPKCPPVARIPGLYR